MARHQRSLIGILTLALFFTTGLTSQETVESAEEERDFWDELIQAMSVLTVGSRDDRLALFDDIDLDDGPFYAIDLPPDDDEATTARIVARLLGYFRGEPDLFVLDRAAAALAMEGIFEATPIFEDWVDHPAPSLRFRVIQHAVEVEEPETDELLEAMWHAPQPDWIRAELIRAMNDLSMEIHQEECPRWVRDPDFELASAAIDCVSESGAPDSLVILAPLLRAEDELIRMTALVGIRNSMQWGVQADDGTLGRLETLWRDGVDGSFEAVLLEALDLAGSTLAREAALERLQQSEGALALSAIAIVAHEDSPETVSALIRRASSGAPFLRERAIDALSSLRLTSEIEQFLVRSTEPAVPTSTRRAAVRAMSGGAALFRELDDDRTWEQALQAMQERRVFQFRLDEIAATDADSGIRELAVEVLDDLGRGGISVTSNCSVPVMAGSRFSVEPEPGARSVRCWKQPEVERGPLEPWRIAEGVRVDRIDRFDDGHRQWAEVESSTGPACWIPQARLLRLDRSIEAEAPAAPYSLNEIDLPVEETRTEIFLDLEEAEAVRTFDPAERLIGVWIDLESASIRERLDELPPFLGAHVRHARGKQPASAVDGLADEVAPAP